MTQITNPPVTPVRGRLAWFLLGALVVWVPIKEPLNMFTRRPTTLDVMSDRLRHSSNPLERRSLYTGRGYDLGIPVLLDTDLLVEHEHIVGPPGSGKTSLCLETIARQLVQRFNAPLVIFDNKGDIGLFNSLRHMARMCGRTFKWFTNRPRRSTHIFNPWDRRLLKRLTLTDILGLFTQSLNLHHGDDYGRAWFSINIRNMLRHAILETIPDAAKRNVVVPDGFPRLFPTPGPIQSFQDLYRVLRALAQDDDEYKAAMHLALVVECLCDFPQLNLAPNQNAHPRAMEHAIFMPEVIREKQIVYFYLSGGLDNAAVAEISKLALYSLYTAANDYFEQTGKRPRIYTIWDEAQVMIGKNIEHVLSQSRSSGMACIMAHQAMSQLNPPGGVDQRELFMQCTNIKNIYGVRDPWLLDYISRTSGTTKYYRCRYDISVADALAGNVRMDRACIDRDGQQNIQAQEYTGPRLSSQDILNVSRQPNGSLMWIDHSSKICPYRGWFPMHTEWPVTQQMHKDYERQPWPEGTDATIEVGSLWPDEDEQKITTPDQTASEDPERNPTDDLEDVWQDLKEKGTK